MSCLPSISAAAERPRNYPHFPPLYRLFLPEKRRADAFLLRIPYDLAHELVLFPLIQGDIEEPPSGVLGDLGTGRSFDNDDDDETRR